MALDSLPQVPQDDLGSRLGEVASLFFRLGTTAFGGPAVHIAMMEEEVVHRRAWVTREEFLDLLGAASLIPGPNSTELALFLGLRRAGALGLVTAGIAFILPAALITASLAWAYLKWGALPELEGAMSAIRPVILVVLGQALIGLGKTALRSRRAAAFALTATAALLAGVHELIVLSVTGLASWLLESRFLPGKTPTVSLGIPGTRFGWPSPPGWMGLLGVAALPPAASATNLFLFFLKVGSVLFGSGHVLIAFLRADLVDRWHWLTERQLLDAVAVGQFTPGPVFTTATFIGYLLAGGPGAIAATVGIFLPAFGFVAAGNWILRAVRRSNAARAFLDGVNLASLALLGVVFLQIAHQLPWNWPTAGCVVLASILLASGRVSSVWLILGAACVGGLGTWLSGR